MMKFHYYCFNLLITVILLVPYGVYASLNITKVPVKGFCVDDQCSKPISAGEVYVQYRSDDACVISSKARSKVTIFSISNDKKLFRLVEINGNRGFFPPNLFRELGAFVEKEDVNIPVEFKCNNKQVTITKTAADKSNSSLSKASDIISSNDSNTASFQRSPTVPSTPIIDQGSEGYFFTRASAAEASESPHSDFAPGHGVEFPSAKEQPDEVKSVPATPSDSPIGDGLQPVLENKNAEAQLNSNDVLNKSDTKSETGVGLNDEASTEKIKDTSAGMEDDDEEEEDDDGIDIDSESIDYSEPTIPSLESSINEKTAAVGEVSSTPPVHLSTSSEGSVGIETPLQTPVVPSTTGLPQQHSLQPTMDISKPVAPGILPSDAPHADYVQLSRKQDEIATTEHPKTIEAIAVSQTRPENVSSPPSSNLSDLNSTASQAASSQTESGPAAPSKDVSSPSTFRDKTELLSSPANKILPAEKAEPETSVNANSTDGSLNATVTGDTTPTEVDSSRLEGATPLNETISIPGEAKSAESDQTQQPSVDTSVSINETAFTESNFSRDITPKSQERAIPTQNSNFYLQPLGRGQQAPGPPAGHLLGQPIVGQSTTQPTTQPSPPELPTADLTTSSPKVQEISPLPPPSFDGLPPTAPPLHTHESPLPPIQSPPSQEYPSPPIQSPPSQEYPSPPIQSPPSQEYPPPPILSPPSQEYPPPRIHPPSQEYPLPPDSLYSPSLATPAPLVEEPSSPLPDVQSVDLHKTPSTTFSESGQPANIDIALPENKISTASSAIPQENKASEQPITVEPPVIAPPENRETLTDPSAIPEEGKAPEHVEDSQGDPETSISYWESFLSLFSSTESSIESPKADVTAPQAPEQISSYSESALQQDVLQKDGPEVATCSDGSMGSECLHQSFLPFQVEDLFSNIGVDSLMTRIIAAAVTLLLCIIAYFFFENRRMDSSLVARVNTLERQLMVLSKENTLLKDECSTNIGQGQLEVFLEELKEAKVAKAELEEQVANLERDLDEAAEANMELNQMLAQTLENPEGSTDDVLASVERLQAQLDGQRDTIGNLTRSISSKNAEIEGLKIQLIECRETISALEVEVGTLNETVANVRREKEDANIAHVEKLQEVQNQLAEALANKVLEESRLGSELSSVKLNLKKTRQVVVAKESEIEALKESFKELKSKGASEDTVGKLFDAVKLHAQVEQLTQERNKLEDSLRGETDARKSLDDHVRVIEEQVIKLRLDYDEAQKEKSEAQTRLEVLSNYFKEKEAQLKKELDLQEILLAQQRGDENSVLRRVKSLQEEVENYRSQNESLKREILDQERDFKGQMATLEKKSHDNWVSARQAERKLEESRQEASLLRNRLTLVEKNLSNPGEVGGVDANGEGGIISPVMGLPGMGPMGALMGPMGPLIPPPPPIDLDSSSSGLPPFMFPPLSPGSIPPPHFIPPLPPPLMAGDRRPPPLGRMSSPPPAPPPPPGHFSPPPPHFDRLDRPSQSPSPTYHRSLAGGAGERQGFRPFAKPNPRKPMDYRGSNPSPGQSNEPMEKTRPNERV